MARLRSKCKADDSAGTARTGERMAEGVVTSQDKATHRVVTTALVRIFEDGSGIFNFKRGHNDITLRWDQENPEGESDVEMHADFGGVEGVLVPSNLPVAVPEANDGN